MISFQIHKKLFILLPLFSMVLFTMLLSGSVSAKTYRWVDANGKIHYSQSIPPSASQNGHTELNDKSGMIVNDVASSTERKKQRKEALLLKAKAAAEKIAMREELTLLMFSSREELEKHYDERIEMISVNLRLFQYHKRKLQKNILKNQQLISKITSEPRKKTLSKQLQKMQSILLEHTRAIEANQREQIEVDINKKRATAKYDKKTGSGGLNMADLTDDLLIDNQKNKSDCSCTCDKGVNLTQNKAQ